MATLDHIVTLRIPFENNRQAQIARNAIAVDPVLKKDEISVDFTASNDTLVAPFAGVSDRVIRVAVSNLIDYVKTIIETIDEFDGEKDTVFTQ
ncbi:hypothetical protein OXX80_001926 [Metschnikowia pulcherrima]